MAYITVDLDDFDTDDLIEELEERGYLCEKKTEVVAAGGFDSLTGEDFERIEHLYVCGQKEVARHEALAMIGSIIRRDLTH